MLSPRHVPPGRWLTRSRDRRCAAASQEPSGSPRLCGSWPPAAARQRGREIPGVWGYAPAPAWLEPGGSLPGCADILAQHAFPGSPMRQSRGANWLHYDTELLRFVAYMPGGMRMSFGIIIVLWQRDRTLRQRDLCTEGMWSTHPQTHTGKGTGHRKRERSGRPGRWLCYRCPRQQRTPPAMERGRTRFGPRRIPADPSPGRSASPPPHQPCAHGAPFCQPALHTCM